MKKLIGCSLLFSIDRILKYWAATNCFTDLHFLPWLTFDVTFNRGVVWGLFAHDNMIIFGLVSLIVFAVMASFAHYTYQRWKHYCPIMGELLVLTGAISNIIDRCVYGGVVDFVALNIFGYQYPAFNAADVYIVVGILIMVFSPNKECS